MPSFPLNGGQKINDAFDLFIGDDATPFRHAQVWAAVGDGGEGHIFPFVFVTYGELS